MLEAARHAVKIALGGQLHREAPQSCRSWWRGACTAAGPLVESEVVVVAARRDKTGAWHVAHYVEADEVVVEAQGVVDIRDVQVDVAHLRSWRQGLIEAVVFAQMAEQLVEVDGIAA